MKLTKTKLKQLIQEELRAVLNEQFGSEPGPEGLEAPEPSDTLKCQDVRDESDCWDAEYSNEARAILDTVEGAVDEAWSYAQDTNPNITEKDMCCAAIQYRKDGGTIGHG